MGIQTSEISPFEKKLVFNTYKGKLKKKFTNRNCRKKD